MDYDDNDFQGQNLHLAGEGSSKFSPVLRPYALPKFDFDDSLQGHLRFDSLVENEVFLGIPSQEDNHWIEDFSRGSSGIEFSSSATESCSISRRNNVWSEATSSESVEMLLKSVGQEEMVRGETIIEESDACDELGDLTDQMEPHLKQEDKLKDVMDPEPALPSDECLEHFSGLNDVKGSLQTQEAEISAHGSSHEMGPNDSSAVGGIIVTESNPGVDKKCDDANQSEVNTSLNVCLDNKREKNSSGSEVQIDDMDSSTQDIAASVQVLDTEEPEHQLSDVSFENENCFVKDTVKAVGERHVLSKEADADDQILKGVAVETGTYSLENLPGSSSKAESIELHSVETGINNFEEPAILPLKGGGDQQIARDTKDLFSTDPEKVSECEPKDLSYSSEIQQHVRGTMHGDLPVVLGDNNLEGHAVEVSNMKAGIHASSELKFDQTTYAEDSSIEGKDHLRVSEHKLDREASGSNSEASLFSGVVNKQGGGSSNSDAGDLLSLTVACSSTELLGKKNTDEILKVVDDASGVHKESSNAEDHISSSMVSGSEQKFVGSLVPNPNDLHYNQDISLNEKENAKLPDDSSSMDCEIIESLSNVKSVETASQGEGMEVNNEVVIVSECVTTTRNEAALNVAFEKTNLASHDTVDGVPLLSETGATVDQFTGHLDENKKIEDEGTTEASLLSLKESSEGEGKLGPILELEKGASHSSASAWKLSQGTVDQSLPTLGTCNSEIGSEQSVEILHKTVDQSLPVSTSEINQNSSVQLEVCPHLCDSVLKEGVVVEGLVPGNHEGTTVEKIHVAASPKVADSVKRDCGSPTVVGCIVLSQSEKEDEEGVKGSTDKKVPFSELTVQSTSQNVSGNDAAKDERVCSSEVHSLAGLPDRETSKDGQSITPTQTCKMPTLPKIVEGSPSTPSTVQIDSKMVLVPSRGSSLTPDGEVAHRGSKGTPERKTRRASGRSTGKENAKKGKHVKETAPMKLSERGDKSGGVSMSLPGSGQLVQFEGLKPYGNVESSSTIPCGVVSVPTSNLPDLNTSAPPSALFQQPFTDLQQVQLRAQIFVYGSVIQGTAPDEACMVSAFGADGRSVWEPVWRACVEKIQGQKSHLNKSETPVQPRSESRNTGAKSLDQSAKRGAHQSKMVPSPLGRASSKDTPPPVVNSVIPLSSPLWNISTPDGSQSSSISRTSLLDYHQTMSSIHPFQSPLTRSFVGHTTSWLPQAPFPGPWVTSPQTSVDASARFSVLPMTEAVKLTPVKESSALVSSGTKNASLSTMVRTAGPSVLAGTSSPLDMKKMSVLPGQNSTDPKPRKRKKATVSETHGRIPLLVQTQTESVSAPVITTSHLSQTESVSAPVITSHLSSSVVSTPACFALEGNAGKIVTAASLISSIDHPKRGELNAEQKVIIPEETFSKVEEAKRQAEDAAALAAAAVSHSHSVWSQLDKLKNSGLVADVKAKLASAAVAVAAAASVAKAAAAAAEIASNAALQAKLMADEALTSGGTSNVAQIPNGNNFGKATSASILKGGDGSDFSSSIIVAAREAVRRRVEAASAASKQAENMDAIVKAAELAADAVSQAGKMVAMGDPLPLNLLVEAGPEDYWRVPQMPSEQGVISNNINREQSNAESIKGLTVPDRHAKDGLSEEAKTTTGGVSPLLRQVSRESEDHMRAGDGISSSFNTSEKDSRGQRSRRASELAKTIGVVPESEFGSRSASIIARDEFEKGLGTLKENIIKEGCHVEVCKDGDVFKAAWFSAEVLSLQDGRAFVCYTDLQSKEGQLKEWVALEGEANQAPRIRMAHPVTTMRFEGTRKRRRAAMGDYVCAIGDRVDVWIQDCWREGVITEKNKKDDTTLTVHFPAEGKTSVVKAWQLRPALIWKDGEWIEWLSLREKDSSSQGDTPQEKRLKLGIPQIEGIEKDRISKKIELGESGKLPLSANEKIFNVGKNIGDENKPNALRATRTGLQKEGSRVIFGVPKPGKKRKFMEVSKHYVAERSSKTNESNEPVKFAKYLMPQGSGSRGWKNTKFDVKEKQAAESKTKVLKSGKPPSVSGRTLPQKDKFLSSSLSAQNDGNTMDNMLKDSVRTDENESGQQSLMESGSFSNTEGAAEGPVLFSSLALRSDAPSKKMSSSNAKSEQVNRGKVTPSSGKLPKVEVKDKRSNDNPGNSVPDVAEPRRSNRRIQPTSRLLEGLQSSLIVSKIPSVSHDKSHRSQNRGAFKGNK